MKRREFITLLGSAAAAWPLTGRAQQPAKLPVVGVVSTSSAAGSTHRARAFRDGLSETGVRGEGQNVTVEYHWMEGQPDGFCRH